MVLAQHPQQAPTMNNLLHHMHSVFQDHLKTNHQAVMSDSKVQKGDATFSTTKCILGWIINMHRLEIHLPTHHQECLKTLITSTFTKPYSTSHHWQHLLGELRRTSLAIHSAKYLFSVLQHALLHTNARRFQITVVLKATLQNWSP